MTYRSVPQRYRLAAQLATLLGTAVLGLSISLTPVKVDPKLSQIEMAMNADVWAYLLVFFGLVGFFSETYTVWRHSKRLFWVISVCHIMLCALISAYSLAALVGVLHYAPWNFGAPDLGLLLAFWHFIYVKRKPKMEVKLEDA